MRHVWTVQAPPDLVMSWPPLQTYASPPLDDSEPADSEPVPGPGVEGGHGERFGLHFPSVLQYALGEVGLRLMCGLWPCIRLEKKPDDDLSEVGLWLCRLEPDLLEEKLDDDDLLEVEENDDPSSARPPEK